MLKHVKTCSTSLKLVETSFSTLHSLHLVVGKTHQYSACSSRIGLVWSGVALVGNHCEWPGVTCTGEFFIKRLECHTCGGHLPEHINLKMLREATGSAFSNFHQLCLSGSRYIQIYPDTFRIGFERGQAVSALEVCESPKVW